MKIGVVFSGCGYLDGSEIFEAVLTLLALEKAGATVVAMAPDIEQAEVVNHYSGQESRMQSRDVLAESARITRGKILSLSEVSAHDIDALILIGGFGAAKNLCTYAVDGAQAHINPEIARLLLDINGLGKPIGAMCIAPVVVALALRGRENAVKPTLTVGNDGEIAARLEQFGAKHLVTDVTHICFDPHNKVVSTAAFMLAQTPGEAEEGINKLVAQIVQLVREIQATCTG